MIKYLKGMNPKVVIEDFTLTTGSDSCSVSITGKRAKMDDFLPVFFCFMSFRVYSFINGNNQEIHSINPCSCRPEPPKKIKIQHFISDDEEEKQQTEDEENEEEEEIGKEHFEDIFQLQERKREIEESLVIIYKEIIDREPESRGNKNFFA